MKKLINTILVVLTCFAFSCETYVEDLNVDPNSNTDAPAELILTGAQVNNMYNFHLNRVGIIAAMWSGQLTGVDRQYLSYQDYQYAPIETSRMWNNLYQQVYVQLELAKEKFENIDNRLGVGISKIVQAHAIGTAAALYGDIPFSQAADPEVYPNPIFDAQEDVYANVQVLLNSGISDLEAGIGSLPGGTDIHFDGDRAKWIEVARTLKARFYLETRDYDRAYDEALLGISTPSNSMLSKHTSTTGARNGYFEHQITSRPGDVNVLGSYLSGLLDPGGANYRGNAKTDETARFNYYYVDLGDAGITGAIEPNYLTVSTGDLFNGFIAADAEHPLVSYQENLLILAETATRVKGFDIALGHLNEFRAYMNDGGYIDATYTASSSLGYDAYDEADFQVGGMNNFNGVTREASLLEEVLEERYVTFFMQIVAFNDVRRTRGEASAVPLQPTIGDALPERFYWGNTDNDSNSNAPALPGLFEPTSVNSL